MFFKILIDPLLALELSSIKHILIIEWYRSSSGMYQVIFFHHLGNPKN